jgi:hypothetical protein
MLVAVAAGCGGDTSQEGSAPSRRTDGNGTTTVPSQPETSTTPTRVDLAQQPCQGVTPPATYQHVVVVALENRAWSQLGGVGFGAMPYLASLAKHCAFYAQWHETNPMQRSLTQYIGLTSGVDNPSTVNNCRPSAECSSSDDNIFRQVRRSGGTARNYVDGASQPCSDDGNAFWHIPALYFRGSYQDATGTHSDADFCTAEVRPANELDPNTLPTFTLLTPDLCHNGHDCPDSTVDEWARVQVGAILAGDDYQAGNTAVFVWWDGLHLVPGEDRPVPNLVIAPSALPGPRDAVGSDAAALRTFELLLGLPLLAQGQLPNAPDLRASAPV